MNHNDNDLNAAVNASISALVSSINAWLVKFLWLVVESVVLTVVWNNIIVKGTPFALPELSLAVILAVNFCISLILYKVTRYNRVNAIALQQSRHLIETIATNQYMQSAALINLVSTALKKSLHKETDTPQNGIDRNDTEDYNTDKSEK